MFRASAAISVGYRLHTRLVACALTSGEKTFDYKWALRQLLRATEQLAPEAIMVDKDAAIDAACTDILAKTQVINYLRNNWKNIHLRLHGPLSDKRDFTAVSRSPITSEYDVRWQELCHTCRGSDGNVGKYLRRLYKDRFRWAWPWVLTSFTAGMETTQRVEKTHHRLKIPELNSKTSLIDVLNATISRIECELFMANYTKDAEGKKAQAEGAARNLSPCLTAVMFPKVVQVNNDMLGGFTRNKMRREMDWSFATTRRSCKSTAQAPTAPTAWKGCAARLLPFYPHGTSDFD
ncbi:hypothetical protein BGZ58_004267 [Dissophora ornata]|nr:hypothetical protein BGZ58_004267 [Dissophora ornata]